MMAEMQKLIGTHNGVFHSDEVLACYLLKQLDEYKCAEVKRTRDLEELDKCDIVVDVGGVYDHSKKRYDHHQKGFEETLFTVTGVKEDIKLSSAGLIWSHYGKAVLKKLVKQELTLTELDSLFLHMYIGFVKEIDAKDNGIDDVDAPHRYRIHTDISSRVKRLNNASPSDTGKDCQFWKAFALVGKEFTEVLEEAVKRWLPARAVVNEAVGNRFLVHPGGRIIKLNSSRIAWPAHLFNVERERDIEEEILFVIFPDNTKGWRVQAVASDGWFGLRQPVLCHCKALRDKELAEACGIEDATFVHGTGFIGGAQSYEGALQMAILSLEYPVINESKDIVDK